MSRWRHQKSTGRPSGPGALPRAHRLSMDKTEVAEKGDVATSVAREGSMMTPSERREAKTCCSAVESRVRAVEREAQKEERQ